MSDVERAVQRARESAAEMRADGAYGDDFRHVDVRPDRMTRLFKWGVIEPDLAEVRSTRRFGAPMTAFKRLLLRLLSQYHAELLAQQTRFNVNLVSQLRGLEQRIEALEQGERVEGPMEGTPTGDADQEVT